MVEANQYIQKKNIHFVPIIWSWTNDQQKQWVPALSSILKNKKEDLPQIYVYSPVAEQAVAYPEQLELEKISPEVLMFWAKITSLQMEIDASKKEIAESEAEVEGEEAQTTPEKRQEMEEYFNELTR